MPKKFTDAEYAAQLPKKQVGTAVLFLNEAHELLVLKPDYKDGWIVPGGSTDEDESPLVCALRETKEEIGIDAENLLLVGIYYSHKNAPFSDSLKFIYFGGILSNEQISSIRLQSDELEEYKFMKADDAIQHLSRSLRNSVPACLEAIDTGSVAYIESGSST